MNLKTIIALAVVAGLGVSIGLAELGDASKLPAPAGKAGLTYAKDIKPLVETSCLKCHSGKRPKSKYSMETLPAIIKGGSSDEAAIVAGDSAKSPLVHYIADLVEELEMPPVEKREKYPAWTKEQIALVRAWIDQGAK